MKIEKLTPEQEAQMPTYSKKWIEIGLRTGETDWNTFDKYMPICYEKAGLKYPSRLVRVQSPLVGALAASVAEGILQKRHDAVHGAVGSAVSDAVRGAVGDAVRGAVSDAVSDAVRDAVRGAVSDAVSDAVHGAVGSAVRDAVSGAVSDAVRDAVSDAVHGAVGSAVRGAVGDAVETAILIAKKAGVALSWHYWLGGQFWVGWGGWYWGVAFVNFFFDICNLKLSQDIMERAEAYRKVCESVNYIWPNRDFVMVCARPVTIYRNDQGRLHNEHGMAIQYPDGWGLYLLNGVRFPETLYKKIISREMPMEDILKITDIDQRVQAIKFAKNGLREFYISQKGKKIDSYIKYDTKNRPINYELWTIPAGDIFTCEVRFCIYDCPSAQERGERKEYVKGTPVELNTVADSMAWGMSDEAHSIGSEYWKKCVPLLHES